MVEVHVVREVALAPAEAWARVSDHEHLIRGPGTRCRVTRAGVPAPNGLGALREVESGPLRLVEEVTAWDAPRRYQYLIRSLSGADGRAQRFRHAFGEIALTPRGAGVRIDWRSRFSVPVPLFGLLIERVLARRVRRTFGLMLDAALAAPPAR